MPFFCLLAFFAAARATVVPQAEAPAGEPLFQHGIPEDYSFVDIEWRGFAGFDKDQVFKGTIEDVIHQMRQIKGAQFTPDFMLESSSDIANGSTNPHNAAYDPAQTYIQCGGASTARVGPIMDGISYLQKLHDDVLCSNGAGPRNCGRISCSWNSAISWCNEKTVPSDAFQCNIFAWYAQEILDDCAIYDQNPRVNGADWDSSFNFTVVVDGAWC